MWFQAEKDAQGAIEFFHAGQVPPAHKIEGHSRVALSTKALQTKEGNYWPGDNCHLWAIPSQKAFVVLWLRTFELDSIPELEPVLPNGFDARTDDPPRSLSPPIERAVSVLIASPVAPPLGRSQSGNVHLH